MSQDAGLAKCCVAHELLTQVEEFLTSTGRDDLSETLMTVRSKLEGRIAVEMGVAVTSEGFVASGRTRPE